MHGAGLRAASVKHSRNRPKPSEDIIIIRRPSCRTALIVVCCMVFNLLMIIVRF